jgi:FdhD protein
VSDRTARRRVTRIRFPRDGAAELPPLVSERADLLAAEEPLGIRIAGQAVNLTMRTPGDDLDLAAGFLFSEGIVTRQDQIAEIKLCDGTTCGHAGHDGLGNIVDIRLTGGQAAGEQALGGHAAGERALGGHAAGERALGGQAVGERALGGHAAGEQALGGQAAGERAAAAPRRNFMTTSACGVCGKAEAAAIFSANQWDLSEDQTSIQAARLAAMPDLLRDAQRVFASTGGLHAAGAFSARGELLCVREDVGRHNAVDKVVGWALRSGRLPLRGCVLMVSGRASFELVQKAVLAGFPVLAAVSAPSSLAADLAERFGLTLVGFLRGGSMNVYTAAERVRAESSAAAR